MFSLSSEELRPGRTPAIRWMELHTKNRIQDLVSEFRGCPSKGRPFYLLHLWFSVFLTKKNPSSCLTHHSGLLDSALYQLNIFTIRSECLLSLQQRLTNTTGRLSVPEWRNARGRLIKTILDYLESCLADRGGINTDKLIRPHINGDRTFGILA